ncbi:Major facilitator superfamily domain, general substrate transporter [Penicillium expansum]|uniref:Major facilitator superfamily domain, general substrate transporter n=1 Tax=Penicillium expansum TaxID=27334 RepID=A0A0A2K786_PENEN|nr:Major facilitator superfamily domain, general substrate transporter [Penicillium expansum]KGO45054.1 Major facilitator superfamily domain, general substrate transporter [Penicillium expansum]KGO60245.1 Major facilitator superfamily domain, general substrate transporter [Penicillium expansum]
MSDLKGKGGKLSPLGLFKEIFNWYPSSYPAEERKLLFKLDLSILIFACLCFFVKYLDQTNISNAYVSGLKEDFGLYGNELNYFNVCYFTSYVLFQIPGLLLMSRPKLARWLLPTLEVLWGICTFAQSRVTNVHQLYALRFLVGMFEAPVFAGTHFILGSWYTGPELFKRAGTWFICNPLGSMVSGYLQAAAYTNLSGVGGMPGWRWLFVIDGIFTIPVALLGFFIFPGIPGSPRPFYMTERDVALAKERTVRAKIRQPGKMSLDVFKRSFKRWHIWVFITCYACMIICSYPSSYMSLWLKQEGYSIESVVLTDLLKDSLPVRDDAEERALIMGSMMTFGYSFNIWVPLLAYPTAGPDGAPRWRKGWPISFVFFFLLWAGFVASVYIWRREQKKEALESPQESSDEETDTVIVDGTPALKN